MLGRKFEIKEVVKDWNYEKNKTNAKFNNPASNKEDD
jgi:hypothetical protein